MIEVEAVLCEDCRNVLLYIYQGKELIATHVQALPFTITEEAFEEVRHEWQGVFTRQAVNH